MYSSVPQKAYVGRPQLSIIQESSNENTYIKEGDQINYIFKVTNEGTVTARNAVLIDEMPEGIYATRVSYKSGDTGITKGVSPRNRVEIEADIKPYQTIDVNVTAVAGSLNGEENRQTFNTGNISATNTSTEESNAIEIVIEPSENTLKKNEKKNSAIDYSSYNSSNTSASRKYTISGIAWLDLNRDGVRSYSESTMSGLTVRLVNNESKTIVDTITTGSDGKYTFNNVENGTYIVLINYDTEKYKLTTYKKSGVASNVNSDFESKTLQQEGKETLVAASEIITIASGSISGIDMGLQLADSFDLKIDKAISKVTVQTLKGTTTDNYDNSKFVKAEIAAKNLTGATVYVEYTITVTNVGDIKGYAKKLVDYLPEGMTFNSTLSENSKWYTGSDGNLYTNAFANKELAKGQSATIKLVLTRQMTEDNTDIVSNQVEIYEDYNKSGETDINSKPGNKSQTENDLSKADIAIMVKTGEELIYASVIMTTISLMIIVVFVVYTQIILRIHAKKIV